MKTTRKRLILIAGVIIILVIPIVLTMSDVWLASVADGFMRLSCRNLVASIETEGGEVHYRWTGFADEVGWWVNCSGTGFDDRALENIAPQLELLRARYLVLIQASITKKGLDSIRRLKGLRLLDLGWTKTGDDGLGSIAALTSLRELYLNNTRVTEAGVRQLLDSNKLPNLKVLAIGYASIPPDQARRIQEDYPTLVVDLSTRG
jgi:hypothetical protein